VSLTDRDERLLAVIEKAKRKESDTLIIKTMRFAVKGMVAIIALFVIYLVCELYVGSRLGDIRYRLDKLEQKR
jgi:hypothetical protein